MHALEYYIEIYNILVENSFKKKKVTYVNVDEIQYNNPELEKYEDDALLWLSDSKLIIKVPNDNAYENLYIFNLKRKPFQGMKSLN